MKRVSLMLLCFLLLLTSCKASHEESNIAPLAPSSAEEATSFVKAVWIPYMEVEELLSSADPVACRAAIAACMEDCRERGVNTVYFHVRANSDAYYRSALFEPRGTTKQLLESGFDPLQAALEEAHARGLALHAWVNPYRIGADAAFAVTADTFEAGGRFYYIPTAESTHTLVVDGVRELVEGYAIDGVQFDDYFYPEGAVPSSSPAAFEQEGYTAYLESGGALSVGDWRRNGVNRMVSAVYEVCHRREGCVFGISPAYDLEKNRNEKYADVALWAAVSGYVDYLCPQLYFGFLHQYAPFAACLQAWDALERADSVAMIGGLAAYKTGLHTDTYAGVGAAEWSQNADILARQAALVKETVWDGIALYSHQSISADEGREAAVVANEWQALEDVWTTF